MRLKAKTGLVILAISSLLAGCATIPDGAGENPADPLEKLNRHTTEFNQTLDTYVAEPLAKGYKTVVPEFVRNRFENFFSNLWEPANIVNNALQGKVQGAFLSLARFMINSTVGLGGLFDVASFGENMEERREDFGQTLAVWGVPAGPYLVIPFFGPSTMRDAPGLVVDYLSSPLTYADGGILNKWSYADNPYLKWGGTGLELVTMRAKLLTASGLVKNAVDPYIMTREAYLANRKNAIYDGNPPLELIKDEFEDEEEEKK